ncbi:MAG: hypothetical protein AB1601_02150 [Planctomycetota bacterium]
MNRQQISIRLALRELGFKTPPVQTFDGRLAIQKCVYLAQAAGAKLGYHFRWYLRGPYCPELTDDAFAIASELQAGLDEAQGWVLPDGWRPAVAAVRALVPEGNPEQHARRLELLASVCFLAARRGSTTVEPAELQAQLKRYEKDFTVEEVQDALGALREHNLLSA